MMYMFQPVELEEKFESSEIIVRRKKETDRLAPWKLRGVLEYIEKNLAESVELSKLAAISRLSSSHFGRAFKGSTGMPPHRWHMYVRVQKAKALLAEKDSSLADVAAATGFADQSHFTRVFAKIAGTTPGAWRRMQFRKPEEKATSSAAVLARTQ